VVSTGNVAKQGKPAHVCDEQQDMLGCAGALVIASPTWAHQDPIRPDPNLTPGAVVTRDPAVFCHDGYSRSHRHTSGYLKARVYREYGIAPGVHHYEIDHLIPLSLGGADVAANLWPESRDTQPWNAEVKDRLEWRLLHLVCGGQMSAAEAQQAFAEDWIAAYQRYCPTEAGCQAAQPRTEQATNSSRWHQAFTSRGMAFLLSLFR
jgi:hypothetical protein